MQSSVYEYNAIKVQIFKKMAALGYKTIHKYIEYFNCNIKSLASFIGPILITTSVRLHLRRKPFKTIFKGNFICDFELISEFN